MKFKILLIILISIENIYAQDNKDRLIISLMVAEECNTYANFTEKDLDYFIHNNIKITSLESDIMYASFYKIEVIQDSVFNFLSNNCREYVIGIIGRPPYKLRLKGFILSDYLYLYQYLREEKYTRRDIRDIEIQGLNPDCLKEAMRKRRSHKIIDCLEPCGLIDIF